MGAFFDLRGLRSATTALLRRPLHSRPYCSGALGIHFDRQNECLARPLRARRRPPRTDRVRADTACGTFKRHREQPFADIHPSHQCAHFQPRDSVIFRFLRITPYWALVRGLPPAWATLPRHSTSGATAGPVRPICPIRPVTSVRATAACIRDSVAFGVAIRSFLADDVFHHRQSGMSFPGFRMFSGSNAALMPAIRRFSASLEELARYGFFA